MDDFEKITRLGEQLQETDYADPDSVKAHNQAAGIHPRIIGWVL